MRFFYSWGKYVGIFYDYYGALGTAPRGAVRASSVLFMSVRLRPLGPALHEQLYPRVGAAPTMTYVAWLGLLAVAVLPGTVVWAESPNSFYIDIEEVNVHPEREHTVEVKEPEDQLSKGDVYVGSLTFAGFALFGSTLLAKIALQELKTKKQKWGAVVLYVATFSLVAVHVTFAFMYEPDGAGWKFVYVTLATLFGAFGVWAGYQLTTMK